MIGTEFIKGQGLGNQLLCYISARCIALERGCDFGCVNPQQVGNVLHEQRGMYFMQLDMGTEITPEEKADYTLLQEADERIYTPTSVHDLTHGCYISGADPAVLTASDNTLLYGNLQAEEYFLKYRDQIREWLAVNPEFETDRYTRDNLCIINVRGGEYTDSPELYLDRRYFLNAVRNMKKIRPDMEFVVITEDVESARKVLPEYECHHFDMAGDYVAIKNAKYLILCNTSFAVLPALVSTTLEKAIAPKYWARHNVSDGYWSSEQNIYSFLSYQDRKGRLYTAEECRQELAAYKKSARFARKPRTAPEGFSLKLSLIPVRLLRVRFYARKALRSLLRRLGVIRQAG